MTAPAVTYSEVTPETVGLADDPVAQALHALAQFGTETRWEAEILLANWARRHLLDDAQFAEVLAYYPPLAEAMAPPVRWSQAGGAWTTEVA